MLPSLMNRIVDCGDPGQGLLRTDAQCPGEKAVPPTIMMVSPVVVITKDRQDVSLFKKRTIRVCGL